MLKLQYDTTNMSISHLDITEPRSEVDFTLN